MTAVARFVCPTPSSGYEPGERPVPIGYPLVDATIGGLRPGGVTVVTATDRQLRLVVAASIAGSAIARHGRPLLGARGGDTAEVVEILVAHARGQRLSDARAGRVRTIREAGVRVDEVTAMLARHVTDAASAAERISERARIDALVVLDADDGGCADGSDLLPPWRALAAARAIPIVLVVTGRAPGWDDPQDAHVEGFRTYDSGRFGRFIVRGVPPLAPASERFEVLLVRDRGRAVLRRTPWRCPNDRERPRPAAEPDFDGTYHPRPTLMTQHQLAERLACREWRPANEREGALVIDALAAANIGRLLRAPTMPLSVDDARVRDVVAMCGGPVAWAVAVIESVQDDLHPELARRTIEAGLRMTGQLDE